ncbi:D-alanyl-D-alanine carboxypeptidase DacC [Actinorhabdospora filicis]|uniref:D-alanyl-D-alanine carboxypeptidase DacC n=1 Tax=Actinorhabdospora filicis TaxID=1785913 RepID=A0A9W6SE57_9ACTN|nr:D-alanyl-D-alanine carboxypeptidase/D-alanyl-D-alanine-endopeptidase [Actinorhabdospora filicis]GLZ75565.1 D-alanyl-D-alanine carboxypeptidase DacC [Actinorhabdospora filicis]
MRRKSIGLLLLPLLAAATAVTLTSSAQATGEDPKLAQILDGILQDARLSGAQASVTVRDGDTGQTLYDRDASHRGNPGSNLKILTSAAAMSILGPEYTFGTQLRATVAPSGGVLNGDLYLRGTGDPTMTATDYDTMARDLAATGVTKVTGSLVGDDTWFDSTRLGLEWAWDDEGTSWTAETSALSVNGDTAYNTNTTYISVTGGTANGDPVKVTVNPPSSYITVVSTAKTGASMNLGISRDHGSNVVRVNGTVPAGQTGGNLLSVWQPTGYATDVLRQALVRNGITVTGATKLGVKTPQGSTTLVGRKSMPLKQLLKPFLKWSRNMHAEVLVKAIGQEVAGVGSWGAGLEAVAEYGVSKGVDDGAFALGDGSGLSRRDFISAADIADVLTNIRSETWYATWLDALPVAGNPDYAIGGTLQNRMKNTAATNNLRGKTGSMTGVSALSGYVTTADGRHLIFAVQLNDLISENVKPIEDRIGVALASYTTAPSKARFTAPDPEPAPVVPGGVECSWVVPARC